MNTIIEQFSDKKNIYKRLETMSVNLIKNLLDDDNDKIETHFITSRLKEESSLDEKIRSKGDKYNSIDDITDIVGIRIITYLENDIDRVAAVINREFDVDEKNSTDKRGNDSNVFGYKSLHYVVSISDRRCEHLEYKKFSGIKFEIQIRSILQHAWAEIEHDLGYKSPIGVPEALKRNFSRLSALLEIADIEFVRLKENLLSYQDNVTTRIKDSPDKVEINVLSLESLMETNETLAEARSILLKYVKIHKPSKTPLDHVILGFEYFRINTIGEIEKILIDEKNDYLAFVNKLIKARASKISQIVSITPLVYFLHYLSAKTQNKETIIDYLKHADFSFSDRSIDEVATQYMGLYKELPSQNVS